MTVAEGSPERALRLAGAIDALTLRTGIRMMHSESRRFEHWVRSAREALDPVSAAAASAEARNYRWTRLSHTRLTPIRRMQP